MPKASRNERRKRQVKRTNSLLKRQLKTVGLEGFKNYIMLCAILAQKGGEITVTAGTPQQAQQDITKLGYTVTPSEVVGELLVRLVVNETALPPAEETQPGLEGFDEGPQPFTPEQYEYLKTEVENDSQIETIGYVDATSAIEPVGGDSSPTTAVDPSPEPLSVLDTL